MLMKALADGLQSGGVLYQQGQERIGNKEEDGYLPNPSGLLEVGQMFYKNAMFLRQMPDDSLVKILYDGLPNLPSGDWYVIFMERDESEILASCDRVDRHLRQVGVRENAEKAHTFDVFRPYRRDDIDHVLGIMEKRLDVRLLRLNYADVVADPISAFNKIKYSPSGKQLLDINVEQAAAVVNPKHYRFRTENENSASRITRPSAESTHSAV